MLESVQLSGAGTGNCGAHRPKHAAQILGAARDRAVDGDRAAHRVAHWCAFRACIAAVPGIVYSPMDANRVVRSTVQNPIKCSYMAGFKP